jgi:ubiquinone/menaquinone biosynthesis C-methylase UbiE
MSNSDLQKLIEEYTLDYCEFLEAVYGEGMLSEGGSSAIDAMFASVDLEGKTALDIGAGLGGAGVYLARKFSMRIVGLEINSEMVNEASKRVPEALKNQVSFQVYTDISKLDFETESFDIVFSKGVLTHVKDKIPLFKEIRRILKKDGKFIINDWLSPQDNFWGKRLLKMCEIENLTLYAFSETTYKKILHDTGFKITATTDETEKYSEYNQQLSADLQIEHFAKKFIAKFGMKPWEEAHYAYQLIASSMRDRELLVKNFICELDASSTYNK